MRSLLRQVIEHFEHILPAQGPIKDFVHHNTLHGFQHLPFPQALAAAHKVTGAYGYLPEEQFHACFRAGRVSREDLQQVLDADPRLDTDEDILDAGGNPRKRRDIMLAALLHPLKTITGCQLNWQVEELNALAAFQPDVDNASRGRLLEAARAHGQVDEATAINDLWSACLHTLGLDHYILHPEELLDISPEQAEKMLSAVVTEEEHSTSGRLLMDRFIEREADTLMESLFGQLGQDLTLAGLLKAVTGEDLMATMRPLLIRHVGSFLDQGLAAWNAPDRQLGFYAVWRKSALQDLHWVFEELPD